MALQFRTVVPVVDIYAIFRHEDEDDNVTYHSAPIIFIAIYEDPSQSNYPLNLVVKLVTWNVADEIWADPQADPEFVGVGKTKGIEAHYTAEEEDLAYGAGAVLTQMSDKDLQGLIESQTAKKIAGMIADKRVRDILARKVKP